MWILNNALTVALASTVFLYLSYRLYGRFLAERVFRADPSRPTPAVAQRDGVDFVPTRPEILFGHHFASIAGLGPILGPAIAVYWGWLPALIWVLAGCVLIGGVHDLAALFTSIRHRARSIGDVTSDVIGPRARILFLLIIFFLLALAMGAFAIQMSTLFTDLSPQAVVPTFSLIAIAMVIGVLVYRRNWRLGPVTALGVGLMLATTYAGLEIPVPLYRLFVSDPQARAIIASVDDSELPEVHGIRATRADTTLHYFQRRAAQDPSLEPAVRDVASARQRAQSLWVYILLAYACAASVLPVWFLLQPRDYINCFQLYFALGLLMLGYAVAHPQIAAPAFGTLPSAAGDKAPGMLPFLFITIACGAVSGFHNLVSSGTTARQIRSETDACVIGYGAMLTEGLLAVLVILACTAGLGAERHAAIYGHWAGLGERTLDAFLTGAAAVIGAPFEWLFAAGSRPAFIGFCRNLIAVVVVSFAMTTLDSATRLLRYNIEEIGRLSRCGPLTNRYISSLCAVLAIGYFALIRIDGKPAGLTLWQLFGTTNQLLAALGLMVASVYLYRTGRPVIYTVLPMLVMIVSVAWAMSLKLGDFYRGWRAGGDHTNLALLIVGGFLTAMSIWMIVEGGLTWLRLRQGGRSAAATDPAAAG